MISVRGLSCGLELVDFGVDEEASSDMVVFSKKGPAESRPSEM